MSISKSSTFLWGNSLIEIGLGSKYLISSPGHLYFISEPYLEDTNRVYTINKSVFLETSFAKNNDHCKDQLHSQTIEKIYNTIHSALN